jgi:hypothetical protein
LGSVDLFVIIAPSCQRAVDPSVAGPVAGEQELVRKLEAAIDGWERDVDTKIVST